MKRLPLFIIAAVFMLLIFVLGTVAYKGNSADQSAQRAAAHRASLVRPHSPVIGSADATVEIVEFLDPACETCRAFYPLVKEIMAAHPGRIRLVLRYAPFHKGSDKVVALLEAARLQGRLWQTLEALLATQRAWAPQHTAQIDLVWPQLEGLGLDLGRLRADMADARIAERIAMDLADANTLGVTKTPEFFVNGRPLPSFGEAPLRRLIDDALTAVPRR